MAITNDEETKLEKLFRTELEKQFLRGIRVGIQTCSKVCLEKLNDSSKPLMKRIEDTKKYCAVATQPGFLTKGIDDTPSEEDEPEIKEVVVEEPAQQNSNETNVSQSPNN